MAFNIFLIPVISSEVERVFLAAKRLITDERNCLKAKVIEANKCQRYWLKANFINSCKFLQILAIDKLNILPFVLSATVLRHVAGTTS